MSLLQFVDSLSIAGLRSKDVKISFLKTTVFSVYSYLEFFRLIATGQQERGMEMY